MVRIDIFLLTINKADLKFKLDLSANIQGKVII